MKRTIFFDPPDTAASDAGIGLRRGVNAALVAVAAVLMLWFAFGRLQYTFNWASVWRYRTLMLRGFGMTIVISIFSLIISTIVGTICGLAQRSSFLPLKYASRLYIEVIRGTPLIVQVLIFFYVVANALGVQNRYVVGVLIMSLFAGAYVSEIIRSGIDSVAQSQLESARSIGFTPFQTYYHIIFPQVITRILPPMTGQFASLIKDSSLLSIIAINEFTLAAREVNANTFSTLESYIPLALGYLALTLPISVATKQLERKYAYAH